VVAPEQTLWKKRMALYYSVSYQRGNRERKKDFFFAVPQVRGRVEVRSHSEEGIAPLSSQKGGFFLHAEKKRKMRHTPRHSSTAINRKGAIIRRLLLSSEGKRKGFSLFAGVRKRTQPFPRFRKALSLLK